MGASGANHASGLVPDTPSVAGTTKFLREDGTWIEPMTAGDGISITNNEISVDNTVALKTDLAPAKLGSGIGTCSTSSGTALEVVLSDYNLVQNGFVAVTFSNDVPAGATLNINGKGAKPIIYKGSAIEADVIKADDTVMFCFDGTNYVLISSGGSGAVEIVEYLSIDITCNFPTQASDLIGATVTVTDNDNQETLFSTTWQGTTIEYEVPAAISYTITVGSVSGYTTPGTKTFRAVANNERTATFEYIDTEKIDLGLPSGTLWCSHNVGATSPELPGYFFSWANIEGHNLNKPASPEYSFTGQYNTSTHQWTGGTYPSTPGSALRDAFSSGNPTYDAARAILGSNYRTPTNAEFNELFRNTNITEVKYNNVAVFKLTSKTDNSKFIILPKTGNYGGTSGTDIQYPERALFHTADFFGWAQVYSGGYMVRSGETYASVAAGGYTCRAVV